MVSMQAIPTTRTVLRTTHHPRDLEGAVLMTYLLPYFSRRVRIYDDAIHIGLSEQKQMRPSSDMRFCLFLFTIVISAVMASAILTKALYTSGVSIIGGLGIVLGVTLAVALLANAVVFGTIRVITGPFTTLHLPSKRYGADEINRHHIKVVLSENDVRAARELANHRNEPDISEIRIQALIRAQDLLGEEICERALTYKTRRRVEIDALAKTQLTAATDDTSSTTDQED